MTTIKDLVANLLVVPRDELEAVFGRDSGPGTLLEVRNEIRPADLFCYLGARFGPPNGLQNYFGKDDSDNLVHWELTLKAEGGVVNILGMNFRSEIMILWLPGIGEADKIDLIEAIKGDFAAWGSEISKVRGRLEHWVEFVNPYQRIWSSIETLVAELKDLDVDPNADGFENFPGTAQSDWQERWNTAAKQYTKAFGLCFGIRSMLPVAAEAL